MQARFHLNSLDGIRGAAAAFVVLSHLPLLGVSVALKAEGSVGVLIFFALSGFLMSLLYADKKLTIDNLLRYLSARLGRILPIYILCITIIFLSSLILGKQFVNFVDHRSALRLFLFLGSNYAFWSIPPEVQFYGLFVFVWWMWCRNRLTALLVCFIFATVVFLTRSSYPGISVFPYLHLFLIGSFAGSWRSLKHHPPVWMINSGQIISSSLIFLLVFARPLPSHLSDLFGSIFDAIISGAFVYFLSYESNFSNWVFGNVILTKLGKISFFVYLFHEIFIGSCATIFVNLNLYAPFSLVISIPLLLFSAAVSLQFFEQPAKQLFEKMVGLLPVVCRSRLR